MDVFHLEHGQTGHRGTGHGDLLAPAQQVGGTGVRSRRGGSRRPGGECAVSGWNGDAARDDDWRFNAGRSWSHDGWGGGGHLDLAIGDLLLGGDSGGGKGQREDDALAGNHFDRWY